MNQAAGIRCLRAEDRREALPQRPSLRLDLSAAYIVFYLVLDRISFLEALHGIDITPWNPPAGLTLALLLVGGAAYAPIAAIAAFLSSQVLPLVPIPPLAGLISAIVISGGYAITASAMQSFARVDVGLKHSRDVAFLIAAAVIGAAFVALGFVATYASAGVVPWDDLHEAWLQYWIGDTIGIVVFAPLLLLLWPQSGRAPWRPSAAGSIEAALLGASLIATLAIIFGYDHDHYSFRLFYLLFLPVIYVATRHGLRGASFALFVIQAGLIVSLEFVDSSVDTIRAFQLLMFTVATTGLMLGSVVSERRRVVSALAESQERLAAILNAARDGVLTVTSSGQIEATNPAVAELFGCPAQRLVGTDLCKWLEMPDLMLRLGEHNALPHAEPFRLELTMRRNDGAVFPIEITAGHFAASGDARHTLVVRDITLRRQAEMRAQQRRSEAAQVLRLSTAGEMASALAHEINQPLMAITTYARGCLRLMKEPVPAPGVLREGVEQIVAQAERAGDIISHIREFVSTGISHRSPVDVTSLIATALSLAEIETMQSDIRFELRLAPTLPAVSADHVQIEQVLLNLLRNAVESVGADPGRRKTITIEAEQRTARTVEIKIADTGPGIADDIAGSLFEPFVTTKATGMGLGLSLSRSIVEAHGGRLRLLETSSAGAVFAFDLPICGEGLVRAG